MRESSVDFPLPDGPTRLAFSPGRIVEVHVVEHRGRARGAPERLRDAVELHDGGRGHDARLAARSAREHLGGGLEGVRLDVEHGLAGLGECPRG